MLKYFKNKERQELLEELYRICHFLAEEGVQSDFSTLVKGTERIGLDFRASASENAFYMDLVTYDGEALQPLTIRVFQSDNQKFVHLFYVDKVGEKRKFDLSLNGIEYHLYDLVLGLKSVSRVSALLHALRGSLRNFVY